jgi:cobalt-precorrin-5B (C1)-methyltransferase
LKRKTLRSGYTTGACAAAAAKAAVMELMNKESGVKSSGKIRKVDIPFPDGSRHTFQIINSKLINHNSQLISYASVIKDAGDDPDVTHGAEIVAEARIVQKSRSANVGAIHELPLQLIIKGGKGVGTVTKPGLPVSIGEAAINPVPRKMINEAVLEATRSFRGKTRLAPKVEITISVPKGEELSRKTLNYRLGIAGGISILGTTGIVRPVSSDAWTATISASMDVARATGIREIVLSAGRASEKAHMRKHGFPEEAYVLMGDHLEFSLQAAKKQGFQNIHLCAQWAKMIKIAMATPQTHVRFGALNTEKAVEFLNAMGMRIKTNKVFNTAREIFEHIHSEVRDPKSVFIKVCNAAKQYSEGITGGIPVTACLVSYDGKVVATSE